MEPRNSKSEEIGKSKFPSKCYWERMEIVAGIKQNVASMEIRLSKLETNLPPEVAQAAKAEMPKDIDKKIT